MAFPSAPSAFTANCRSVVSVTVRSFSSVSVSPAFTVSPVNTSPRFSSVTVTFVKSPLPEFFSFSVSFTVSPGAPPFLSAVSVALRSIVPYLMVPASTLEE